MISKKNNLKKFCSIVAAVLALQLTLPTTALAGDAYEIKDGELGQPGPNARSSVGKGSTMLC